ncbi:hypothetical protein A6770_36860 [Nostoc minutum NIES-26]|uniref:Uncharacterized protein n=1 Tax=Nostoc minutum NIES-26 TaxID=1844469 RepID=A0A367RWG4_9NOSO|nr:hypothetical protein A6770_36860 [Nostoc minutum NIES-26]
MLNFQVTGITLLLILSSFSSAWGQSEPVTKNDSRKPMCEPIARVLDGDTRLVAGSEVCKGEYLRAANGGTVEIFCYVDGNILHLKSGVINQQCSQTSSSQAQVCNRENRFNCFTTKGPNENTNRPTLITPYSASILNPRPTLSWNPVSNAIGYVVQIEGTGVDWSKEVNSTSLPYPQEQPAMQPGSIYQVNVLAKMVEQKFIPSSSILMVAPPQKEQQIRAIIERIKSLNLHPDELAVDINRVYKEKKLLTEAIEVLQERVKAKTQNPAIYRTLGDRYLDVGLLEQGIRAYRMAIKYAKARNNLNELARAQVGLELSHQSQLPTRINPAQK